jgi:hypothetical protein
VSSMLHLGKGLDLPLDAVTQTFAILGKRGSGKTTTAVVFVEELLRARQHVVLLDPLDVAWGLRASRDGKAAGYPITVLGGEHADLPLEPTAGAVIAEFVVEHHAPLILSLRQFSIGDQRRFVTDFAERLYALKGKQANRTALHLVIDEVDEFAPQRIPTGHERMFGAIDRIVRRGRSAGLGVTMISQRPAVIHKDILTQAEVLICHQTVSPQDRKALLEWVKAHDAHDQQATFTETLATLRRGEAWVWSPGWLDLFKRLQIRDRTTFDSSATPKAGEAAVTPSNLAPVDLKALEGRIADTIERAKADDPKELRKRIGVLERELASAKPALVAERILEVPFVPPAVTATLRSLDESFHRFHTEVLKAVNVHASEVNTHLVNIFGLIANVSQKDQEFRQARPVPGSTAPQPNLSPTGKSVSPAPARATTAFGFGKAERSILSVLAQYPQGRTKVQIALLAGYSHNGGGFNNALSALRAKGLIIGNGDRLTLTQEGVKVAPHDPLPRGRELLAYWFTQLGKAERLVLDQLAGCYPRGMDKATLGQATGYEPNGGGFNNALSRLRTLELIEGRGELRASAIFFEGT